MRNIKLLLVVSMLVLASSALAHGVSLWAYVEDGTVFIEAFFSNGNKVMSGQIFVLDSSGEQILAGETDNQGKFSFKPPKIDDLKIVLIAGEGHSAEYLLKADELRGDTPQPTPTPAEQPTKQ
ncbi:MAG: hypothetical protein P9M14_11505 [Candidatus Alcyoniella australis]|nr:hypothetical protein [Candidatus Alcyoniella australis]